MVYRSHGVLPVVLFFCLFGWEFSTQRLMDRLGLLWGDSVCWMQSFVQEDDARLRKYDPMGKPIKIDAKKVAKFGPS